MSVTQVPGACPLDCPDGCSWQVTVQDGEAVALRGTPDHPYTRGTLCVKVNQFLEHTRAPDRLLHPLRRIGRKGEGRFERISWDSALGEIARRLKETIERHGGEAIWPYQGTGTLGFLQGLQGAGRQQALERTGCFAPRHDDLLDRRSRRTPVHTRHQYRDRSGESGSFPVDPAVGEQSPHDPPPPVEGDPACTARRCTCRRHRPGPQPHSGPGRRAHRAPSGHGRGARPRSHARGSPGRCRGPGVPGDQHRGVGSVPEESAGVQPAAHCAGNRGG